MILGRTQNAARNVGRLDFVTNAIQTLVKPAAEFLGSIVEGVSNSWAGMTKGGDLKAENARLRAIVESSKLYTERISVLSAEVESLRKLIGLADKYESKKIPARIIGIAPYENRITLSSGSSSGIIPGCAVITGEGLIAVVQTVEANICQASLLTSPTQKIGAVALRSPALPGILRGETGDSLVLELLDTTNPIEPGDMVVTSGLSERIVRGLPIGRVIRVDTDRDFGTRTARIRPIAKLGTTREVLILK